MTPAPSTSYRTQEQVAPPSPALSPNPATPPVCYPLRLAPPPLWPPFPNSPLCYPTPALRLAPPPLWPLFPNPATPPLYRNRHAARKISLCCSKNRCRVAASPKISCPQDYTEVNPMGCEHLEGMVCTASGHCPIDYKKLASASSNSE